MENTSLHEISLAHFKSLFPSSSTIGLGDDFFIMDVALEDRHQPLLHPCRFDGFFIIYCIHGHIRLNVNLNEFEIKEDMMFINLPGNIIRVNELVDSEKTDLHYICIGMSTSFAQGVQMDMMKLFNDGMLLLDNPSIRIEAAEKKLMEKYMELMAEVIRSEVPYKREAVHSLMSSYFYSLSGIWSERVAELKEIAGSMSSNRSRAIFEQFLKLVSEYHVRYRNVGFYADKLCLTPKYLSKLIKNASGKSAPEWIDSYVMLEAKNLLKYSNISIKEIVWRLNFPNQSVFYKFFKARSGMTPSEYRNS